MMQIKDKKTRLSKKRIFILLAALLLTVGTMLTAWYFFFRTPSIQETNRRETTHTDNTSAVKEEQVDGNVSDKNSHLPNKSGENDQPINTNTDTPSSPPEKPRIERASGNTTIRVVATLQQSSDGFCELVLSNGGATKTQRTQVTIGSSYYVCSFDIPRDSLHPSEGWTITVVHQIGNTRTASDAVGI